MTPVSIPGLATHSGRLERWLGKDKTEEISASFRDWYGPPVPLVGVPGGVHVCAGGDFRGPIDAGAEANLLEFLTMRARQAWKRYMRSAPSQCNAGFSSLSDLVSEATAGGKKRIFTYQKIGVAGAVASTNTLWYEGGQPSAGGIAGGAPNGIAYVDSDPGAFPFSNPTGGDTQHFTRWDGWAGVAGNTLMLYDRLFAVEKTMNSTGTEAVSGVPSRYQNTAGGNPDSIAGNFLFIEGRVALAAVSHNWTVCTYKDQLDNASTLPSVTGNAGNIAKRLDMPTSTWFCPLEAGDTGIKALTQMQCSALVTSGNVAFAIGHPIAILAHPTIAQLWTLDGVTGGFNLNRIFDDACLAFLELHKPATTATTYTGVFETVSG